jgi:cytochrome c oxidase cbb3-type subunit III
MSENKKDEDILIEGHTYDGIQEYDNPMPRWWINLFWATILFSIGYCGYYMTGIGPSHLDEYEQELQLALEKKELLAKSSVQDTGTVTEHSVSSRLIKAALSEDSIASGKTIYDSRCMACHGDKGQGLIGPNLTDNYWIHGGSMEEILHIINVGVVEKGMIPWEAQLSEGERINVVAFIRSIQGTNIEGKGPEGEIYEPVALE